MRYFTFSLILALVLGLCLVLSGCSSPEERQEKLLQRALHAEGDRAINAVGKIDNQEHLARVVLEASSENARRNALRRLTDPELLEQVLPVVVFDKNCWVSADAVRKSRDQNLLLRVFIEHDCKSARVAALDGIMTDQEMVRKIALGLMPGVEPSNIPVRLRAMGELEDQEALARIATEDELPAVRASAASRLEDQDLLARLAAEEDYYVSSAAQRRLKDPRIRAWYYPADTERMEDQALLEDIAFHARNSEVRKKAITLLENRTALMRLATLDNYSLSMAARERLTPAELEAIRPWMDPSETAKIADRTLLKQIVRESLSGTVRARAAEMFTDVEFLSDLALNDTSSRVRTAAVKQIVRPKVPGHGYLTRTTLPPAVTALLAKIALEDEDFFVRDAAIEGLTDQDLLARIALEDGYINNRKKAARRLTDPSLRRQVGWWVFREETEKLVDQDLLAKIAVEAADDAVRAAAVRQLLYQHPLARIAVTDTSWKVQHDAIRRLSSQPLLENIASEHPDWKSASSECALHHAAFMINNRELLQKISGNPQLKYAKYARLKLALLDWGEPGFSYSISIGRISQWYEKTAKQGESEIMKYPTTRMGESVVVEVFHKGTRIAAWSGKSSFPHRAPDVEYFPITIDPDIIISSLNQQMKIRGERGRS